MSSYFDSVIGHEKIVRVLQDAVSHPGQAYLFHGPGGVGKRTVAHAFIAELLKIEATQSLESHPDFIRLRLEVGTRLISVEAARDLATRMSRSAAAGGFVIALIEDAERLSESATNALLKSVEEPPKGAIYIFLAEEASRLPVTLRSRPAPVAFNAVPMVVMKTWLEQKNISSAIAEEAVKAAYGSPGLALTIAEQPKVWQEKMEKVRKLLTTMLHGQTGEALLLIENLARACDSEENSNEAWREILRILMAEWTCLQEKTVAYAKVGEGLARAWKMVGSSLSPRLALEWTLAEPYLIDKSFIPSFLKPKYL